MGSETYNAKVGIEQGATRGFVASGGSFDVESGGELDIESGAALKLAGTAVTSTAAELNLIDGGVAGTAVASKAAILGANKELDEFHTAALYLGAAAGTAVSATAAELNKNAGVTGGTAAASKTAVLGANKELDEVHTAALYIGAGAGTAMTATAVELNALAAGVPALGYQVIRANHPAADITAGTATAVPAIAGKSFVCKDIFMRAVGGNVSGPTTVEVVIETTGTVMESHVTADLTSGTWRGTADGTVVITGITAGGLVTAGKKLLVTDTGGTDFATATSLDTICVGYYTTT